MTTQRSAWGSISPLLIFPCSCLLVGDMLFGFDTSSFGGILANPGFINQFGSYHADTDKYAFTSSDTSIISSIPFIGKFLGCLFAGPAIEKFGHRIVFILLSIVSFIGVILEITAADTGYGTGRFAQFLVGRIIVYISVGLVEVAVTTYQAEVVPAAFRGLVVISLQLFLAAGSLMRSGLNKAYLTSTNGVGWKTVTGIQLIFPAYEGRCDEEIRLIKETLRDQVHKGPWLDLFHGTNLRRTFLVFAFYFFQQATGQAFSSTYQTVFYKQEGYSSYQAFTYPIVTSVLGMIAVCPAMYMVDSVDRRGTLMISYPLQALWLFLLAGLGAKPNKTETEKSTVAASFMLFSFCYNMGSASIPYLLGSEIPNTAVREKTQSLGAAWNVLWAFVTNYSIPYLIANLHFGVGWVFSGISALTLMFTFFFLPETKGRALEEIDALFASAFNPFRPQNIQPSDTERRIGELDGGKDFEESVLTPYEDRHDGKNVSAYLKP
ncbi:unnamed protein product [Fusarium graminearum]|uniref:Uncharacterized protein n=1 Tax=Gibberella zeae TaxID=5518 RepID=A0A2H3G9F3_GIBZA|nr:hypothetical protein FGRA07_05144 [Fusarium graminearum]CAG1965224.1 unnamed protein product [Fusarium graminearum]CAG1990259.1 unnamed protein product [Fusarium graminearum]